MVPTFVFGWPTGAEQGDFLALDLGEWLNLFLIIQLISTKCFEFQVEQICEFAWSACKATANSRSPNLNTASLKTKNTKMVKSYLTTVQNA
jgi:hexokinase